MKTALTIAGSDSGAGAGIQADLKTFSSHGVYGMTAITAVTAQNTRGVTMVQAMPADLVTAQIEAVASDLGVDAVKTGMLPNAAIVEAVAAAVQELDLPFLVVDPVMVAKSGDSLSADEAVAAMRAELLERAFVVTPNIPEAEVLAEMAITTDDERRDAARRIHKLGARYVIIKGGHFSHVGRGVGIAVDVGRGSRSSPANTSRPPADIVDLLFDGHGFTEFRTERIASVHTHGTGCTFAAALTAHLALGRTLADAVPLVQRYIAEAIRRAPQLGGGHGPMQHDVRPDAASTAGTAAAPPPAL